MKDFDPGTKDFSPATSDRESWTGREASRLVNPGLVGPLQKINGTAILKKPAIEFAVVADVASNNQKCLPADDARNIPQTHPAAEAPNPDRAE